MRIKKYIKLSIREYLNKHILSSDMVLEATAKEIKTKYYPNIDMYDFNKIVSSDILTSNLENGKVGKYAKWLLKLYSTYNLDLSNLDKANEYISIFDKLLKANKIDNKDINSYESLDDMYDVINKHLNDDPISNKAKISKIKKSAKKIYEDGRFLVIKPLTYESSCYYSKGTKWCTTDKHKYDEYTSMGSLYIIIDKTKRNELGDLTKYIISFEAKEFKYANNEEINFNINPEIKELIKKLVKILKIKPMDLVKIPGYIKFIDNPSEEIQLAAVKRHPESIQDIQNPTEKVQLFVVQKNGMLISGIDNPSKEVQLAAIKQNPEAKKYINLSHEEKNNMEIKHYKFLLDSGIITQREYDDFINYLK